MEKHSFRIVSGDLPKTMRKRCLSTKYYTRKLGEITLFSVVAVSFFPLAKKFSEKIPSIFFPRTYTNSFIWVSVEFDLFPKYYKNNTKILVKIGSDAGNKNNEICRQTGDLSLYSESSIQIKCPAHMKGQHVYVQFLAWIPVKLTAYEIRIIGY